MRITIGGVLLIGGAAAATFLAVGPAAKLDISSLGATADGVFKSLEGLTSLFRSTSTETPVLVAEPPKNGDLAVLDTPPAAPVVAEPAPPVATTPETPVEVNAPPVQETVVTPPAPPPAAPKKRAKKRRTRKTSAKAATPVAPAKTASSASTVAVAKTAAAKEPAVKDALMGSYVAVKLKTGREIKGVMRGKTATEYTIEIPGMGPFKYPLENVVSVSPAE